MPEERIPEQLDVFLHSGAVMLANDLADALTARDAVCAWGCFERLRSEDPDYQGLAELELLCGALQQGAFSSEDPAKTSDSIRRLEQRVQPAARKMMGARAAAFLRPFWLEFANSVRDRPYDSRWPEAYAAGLYLRAEDYAAAERSAERIPDCRNTADGLYWLALAGYRLRGPASSRPLVLRLALVAPEHLAGAIADIGDSSLQEDWSSFWAECVWLDPEDAAAAAWFTPWFLLDHAGVRIAADAADVLRTPAAEAYAVLIRLIELEKHGYSRGLIAARSRLRDLAPDLFQCFMRRRPSSAY